MPTSPFSITGERVPSGAAVVGFRGREAISRPYEYEVLVAAPEGSLTAADLRAALHTRATLALHRDDGEVRRVVHGVFTAVAFVRTLPGGALLLRATLGPALTRLALARRNRVWVDQSVPDVVMSVLRECGLGEHDVELRLENPARYAPVEHLCQYRESNLDFVSRRLEAEGIYYHFEHPEGGASELLVISDSRSFLTPLSQEGVRFTPVGDDDTSTVEGLRTFEYECSAVPAGARARGSDYLRPDLDVSGASQGAHGSALVTHDLESSRDPRDAARHARVRAEEHAAREAVVHGEGRSYELRAGYSFDLEEHPLLSGEYLATAVTVEGFDLAAHRPLAARLGFRAEVFHVAVEAIPASVQYRPERATPVPTVHGTELGAVSGAARGSDPGRYAHLDEHGRYRVRLRFDDDDAKTSPSVPMRMAQPHAGAGGAGLHMPLRDGAEVLVGFLRGDPDLPYIAAAVPDARTASPVTRENATKNVLQTGGGNRITMEDREGAEYIKLATPYQNTVFHIGSPHNPAYEMEQTTDGSIHLRTGHNWESDVDTHRRLFVKGKVWEEYGTPPQKDKQADARRTPHGSVAGSTTPVFADEQYEETLRRYVYGDKREEVTGDVTTKIGGTKSETIIGPDVSKHLGKNSEEYFTGHRAAFFGGAEEEVYAGNKLEIAGGVRTEIAAGVRVELALVAAFVMQMGLSMEAFFGPKIELHKGLSVSFREGINFEKHTITTRVQSVALESGGLNVRQSLLYLFD